MNDNKYLAWTALSFFLLSVGLIVLLLLTSPIFSGYLENPGIIILVIGAFSLLATIMGFLSFKAPQAKVGAIGGLVLLLLVLLVFPVGSESSVTTSLPEISFQEQTGHTGIADLDTVIDTVMAGNQSNILQLLKFSTLSCTHADGLGGPPKCEEDEKEGTKVEVFSFLGPEGHHMRYSDLDDWIGVPATAVYAAYRVSPQAYSNEDFPAGEYAIVFITDREELLVFLQVTKGEIVRIDNKLGNPPVIDFERDASAIILGPQD